MGLEPGGESVDAYSEAADGFDLRRARLDSDCDMRTDSSAEVECLDLEGFKDAAAAGSACIGSVGDSSWTGCGMKAAGGRGRGSSVSVEDSCGASRRWLLKEGLDV